VVVGRVDEAAAAGRGREEQGKEGGRQGLSHVQAARKGVNEQQQKRRNCCRDRHNYRWCSIPNSSHRGCGIFPPKQYLDKEGIAEAEKDAIGEILPRPCREYFSYGRHPPRFRDVFLPHPSAMARTFAVLTPPALLQASRSCVVGAGAALLSCLPPPTIPFHFLAPARFRSTQQASGGWKTKEQQPHARTRTKRRCSLSANCTAPQLQIPDTTSTVCGTFPDFSTLSRHPGCGTKRQRRCSVGVDGPSEARQQTITAVSL